MTGYSFGDQVYLLILCCSQSLFCTSNRIIMFFSRSLDDMAVSIFYFYVFIYYYFKASAVV